MLIFTIPNSVPAVVRRRVFEHVTEEFSQVERPEWVFRATHDEWVLRAGFFHGTPGDAIVISELLSMFALGALSEYCKDVD